MKRLRVELGDVTVGFLERYGEPDSWQFSLLPEYLERSPRPVLGQAFEDDPRRVRRATSRLPEFFSNLVPEGALRELIARQAGVHPSREAWLLAELGRDLPGAVQVTVEEENGGGTDEPEETGEERAQASPLFKFSLAGVQLKMSVSSRQDRFTLPVSGVGGDWIVKLQDLRFPKVPENEFSMLAWARAAGVEVPDHRLVPIDHIDRLPDALRRRHAGACLATRRYDRGEERRIHQEDFAQVLEVPPTEKGKYASTNYETIGKIVLTLCGEQAFEDYVKRLVLMLLQGNGDAHTKNWSLYYPEPTRAQLAPAYDLVFTKCYIEEDRLALNLDGKKDYERIGLPSFRRFGERIDFGGQRIENLVRESADRILAAWSEIRDEVPLDDDAKKQLDQHHRHIHLS